MQLLGNVVDSLANSTRFHIACRDDEVVGTATRELFLDKDFTSRVAFILAVSSNHDVLDSASRSHFAVRLPI